MSYQVLARKYRPASFSALEGQEHVQKALINALENERLHHAYLFTGTRGIGKTTIARILAKCLNCERGITPTPCNECRSCVEISEGRSVDLLEVDAASKTGIDDMRELLDNVQYMPTTSRFKIYLIDEVHMLSRNAFNAMLKTLEEPPEHAKFLFATTDPKKLPITVLSRCLQFNLKNLSPERVVNYLGKVLGDEQVAYDDAALWLLGRAAAGSMRDALSLTDQAIAFGQGELREADVAAMLGTIDPQSVFRLLDGLLRRDGSAILQTITDISAFSPDYSALLDELLAVLHKVATTQLVPGSLDNSQGDQALIEALAAGMGQADVQLYYQIGLIGKRDLPLAPDTRIGFEMVMLRMLAFEPATESVAAPAGGEGSGGAGEVPSAPSEATSPISDLLQKIREGSDADAAARPLGSVANGTASTAPEETRSAPGLSPAKSALAAIDEKPQVMDEAAASPVIEQPTAEIKAPAAESKAPAAESKALAAEANVPAVETEKSAVSSENPAAEPVLPEAASPADATLAAVTETTTADPGVPEEPAPAPIIPSPEAVAAASMVDVSGPRVDTAALEGAPWDELLVALSLSGVTYTLASNCVLASFAEGRCELVLDERHQALMNRSHEPRIARAFTALFEREVKVGITIGAVTTNTPAANAAERAAAAQARAVESIESDENVQALIASFNGVLDRESIAPIEGQESR